MAGEWIPMRIDLADDPAVIEIAAELSLDEYAVVGRLHRLWVWANRHLVSGRTASVTGAWVDRFLGTPGFANAMQKAGWLKLRDDSIVFPNFDRWNSQGAKLRLLASQRKRKERSQKCHDENATEKGLKESRVEKRRVKKKAGGGNPPYPPVLDTPQFRESWETWLQYRDEKSKPVSIHAASQQFKKLAALGPEKAIDAITTSIANDWQGIFPERAKSATSANGETIGRSKRAAEVEAVLERERERLRREAEANGS